MYTKSRKYKLIADKVISDHDDLSYIRDYDIKIAFLSCDSEKRKNHKIVFADCSIVNEKNKALCRYDFIITIYEPNIITLSKEQIKILMWHELSHIGIHEDGEEPKPYIVPHDYEEFDKIIEKHGLRWSYG